MFTGASSGIGLETAYRAPRAVLSTRNGPSLDCLAERIRNKGGHSIAIVADSSRREDESVIATRPGPAWARIIRPDQRGKPTVLVCCSACTNAQTHPHVMLAVVATARPAALALSSNANRS